MNSAARIASLEARLAAMADKVTTLERIVALLMPQDDEAPDAKLHAICEAIAISHHVTVADLRGRSVLRVFTLPRQKAYRVSHDAGFSYPEIARFYGRDHSTIFHGVNEDKARGR